MESPAIDPFVDYRPRRNFAGWVGPFLELLPLTGPAVMWHTGDLLGWGLLLTFASGVGWLVAGRPLVGLSLGCARAVLLPLLLLFLLAFALDEGLGGRPTSGTTDALKVAVIFVFAFVPIFSATALAWVGPEEGPFEYHDADPANRASGAR